MRPIRVGFNARSLVDPHVRGLSRYTVNLLRALSARSDVELFLFSDSSPANEHLAGLRVQSVVVHSRRESLWEGWALPGALRRHRIDVFHAPADRGLPLIRTCPCVVTLHNSYERSHWRMLFPTARQRYWYWKNEWVSRLNADAVITVSDTTRAELMALDVASPRRLRRVHLAPSPEFAPQSQPDDVAVRERHGIRAPYLLYVGGYDEHKNVDELVRAFDLSSLGSHQLVIAARQNGRFASLRDSWRGLRCFERLRLIEVPPAELPALFRGAQFFVNPSVWESFSFQLVEAMACGTPLLTSNRTALPEIAGDAALYFNPTDRAELAGLMERLAADGALRASLALAGRQRVARFSWAKTAEETFQIYKEILN